MKSTTVLLTFALLLCPLMLALLTETDRVAVAAPAWGGDCLSCHGVAISGLVTLQGFDGTADPDESGTGAPDRGPLPVYEVYRGQNRAIDFSIIGLSTGDRYAVELTRHKYPGVEADRFLSLSADCAWPSWDEAASYYTDPAVAYSWNTGPETFTYDLGVNAQTGADYYDLIIAVGGKFAGDGGLFYSEEHFYVKVVTLPGDLNCDGAMDFGDINPFVLALTNWVSYNEQYPECDLLSGDLTGDGQVNSADINPFVDMLLGGR